MSEREESVFFFNSERCKLGQSDDDFVGDEAAVVARDMRKVSTTCSLSLSVSLLLSLLSISASLLCKFGTKS